MTRASQTSPFGDNALASLILDTVESLVVVLDIAGRILLFNRACKALTGFDDAEVIGREVWDVVLEVDDLAAVKAVFAALVAGGSASSHTNFWRTKSGERRLIQWSNTTFKDAGGHARYVVGTGLDITERAKMETSLRENEGRLRTIVDTAPDPVIVIDENGIIETFSRAAEAQFGYTAEEAIGRNVSILMPPPHCDNHDSYIRRYVETGEAHIIGIGRELTGRRKDGTLFPLRLAVGESTVGGRRIFTGFAHDMTEREQVRRRVQELQAELLHVSRMSDMGEMASGLAHELNQPLTAVMNYVNASRRLLRASGIDKTDGTGDEEAQRARIAALLDKAVGQTERAGKTIRHLREFVRHGVGERAGEDINAVVEEACAFALVGFTDAGIKLDLDLQEDLPPAFVDKIQVQQVVLNLVRNAAEAMAEAPRRALRITTRACARETIVVTITDSGPGLAPEILPRLFQPFVTTKPQGMGVGLSICRSIIEAHGGRISARTPEGGGTEFRFTLSSAIDGGESEDG